MRPACHRWNIYLIRLPLDILLKYRRCFDSLASRVDEGERCCGNWERRNMRRNSWFQVTQGNSLFCCLIYISVIINSPTCHLKPKGFYFFHTPQNEMLGRMFQLLFYYIQQQSIAATEVKAIVHPKMKIVSSFTRSHVSKILFLGPQRSSQYM